MMDGQMKGQGNRSQDRLTWARSGQATTGANDHDRSVASFASIEWGAA